MKITRRQFVQAMAAVGAAAALAACGGSSNNSAAGSTAASGAAAAAGGSFNLKLGHNLAEDHAVHIQLTSFAEQVKEKTNGTVNIQIIPNGTLGSESDMISQIQAGALDMAKVSASTLGNFSEKYNAFSVPYVFDDQAHYYTYMDSDSAQAVFESTDDQGFRGLTWLDSGARSFYTKATAIRTPADLKGLKIRTMDSQMAIDMMNCLGGSATVMGYSDIYTGMQQGVIDGAENNVTALRDHGDVTKYYCFDEHTRIPDMVIISSNIWNQFSDDQKSAVTECAKGAFNVILSVFIEAAIVFFVGYVFVYGGWKLTANATNVSSVMRIPFKFLYSILPISGIFIILARVLKYVDLFLESKNKKGENA